MSIVHQNIFLYYIKIIIDNVNPNQYAVNIKIIILRILTRQSEKKRNYRMYSSRTLCK